MAKLFHKTSHKAGLAPGSLVYVGERKSTEVRITLLEYDEDSCTERPLASIEECSAL